MYADLCRSRNILGDLVHFDIGDVTKDLVSSPKHRKLFDHEQIANWTLRDSRNGLVYKLIAYGSTFMDVGRISQNDKCCTKTYVWPHELLVDYSTNMLEYDKYLKLTAATSARFSESMET